MTIDPTIKNVTREAKYIFSKEVLWQNEENKEMIEMIKKKNKEGLRVLEVIASHLGLTEEEAYEACQRGEITFDALSAALSSSILIKA